MIVDTLKSVVQNLSKKVGFFYANIYEANLDLDKYDQPHEVFFVYIPPLENTDDIASNDLIHTKFPLMFFMMRKVQHPSAEYRSQDVQHVIDEMRDLAREFIKRLNEQDVVEKHGPAPGITQVKYISEYGWQDSHLFGVSGQAEVPIMEGKTGCP